MNTLVQAFLDIELVVQEQQEKLRNLRKEEKILAKNLIDAMEEMSSRSIKVGENSYILLQQKPKRKRSRQEMFDIAEEEGVNQELMLKLLDISKGKITGMVCKLKLSNKMPTL